MATKRLVERVLYWNEMGMPVAWIARNTGLTMREIELVIASNDNDGEVDRGQ